MSFTDIHCHALYGCDDGPKNKEDMYSVIDSIYNDNIRHLCMTPHYHPGYFGENSKDVLNSFEELKKYVADKYDDLTVYLGNELRYNKGCSSWLKEGLCNTLNGTEHVLVDFSDGAPVDDIINGTNRILNAGYIPVLAHVEKYRKIKSLDTVHELKQNGVVIQVDAQSVLGKFGLRAKWNSRRMLEVRMVDVVAGDTHGIKRRPTAMTEAYEYISKHYSQDYADVIFIKNPLSILNDNRKD